MESRDARIAFSNALVPFQYLAVAATVVLVAICVERGATGMSLLSAFACALNIFAIVVRYVTYGYWFKIPRDNR